MSSAEEESGGRVGPDNHLDTLLNDIIVTPFNTLELVGLKFVELARYAILLRFQNELNYSITLNVNALDNMLQRALTQVGSQCSDFAILQNVNSEPQAIGLGALHNNYARKPKKHIR